MPEKNRAGGRVVCFMPFVVADRLKNWIGLIVLYGSDLGGGEILATVFILRERDSRAFDHGVQWGIALGDQSPHIIGSRSCFKICVKRDTLNCCEEIISGT